MDNKSPEDILRIGADERRELSEGLAAILENRKIEFEGNLRMDIFEDPDAKERSLVDATKDMSDIAAILRDGASQLLSVIVEQIHAGNLNDLNHQERKAVSQAKERLCPPHSHLFKGLSEKAGSMLCCVRSVSLHTSINSLIKRSRKLAI